MTTTEVRPGQLWADNDPRKDDRAICVDEIDGDVALCTDLVSGRPTRVKLTRFRPTTRGYRLIRDAVPNELRIGSLFSGYGGLEMGVSSVLGGRVVWHSEYDKGPSKILEHRYPGVPNLGDVTQVDWSLVEPVDILTGGSPCQDLSTAGRRAGMTEGTRSNLWVAMREAIAVLRPRLVVWENVRGAYSAPADCSLEFCSGCMGERRPKPALRALGRVVGDLSDLGYDAVWIGLRASDVGAAHARFRVILGAFPRDDLSIFDLVATEPFADASYDADLLPTPTVVYVEETAERWDERRCLPTSTSNKRGPGLNVAIDGLVNGTLLPTPRVANHARRGGERSDELLRDGVAQAHAEGALLPTPDVSSGQRSAESHASGEHQVSIYDLPHLLPTPTVQHSAAGHNRETGEAYTPTSGNTETPEEWIERRADVEERTGTRHGPALGVVAQSIEDGHPLVQLGEGPTMVEAGADRWGPYAAAVHRWEVVLGRPAPDPTERDWDAWRKARVRRFASTAPIGFRGSLRKFTEPPPARLAAAFTEWMMGLPAGWITDVPEITRSEALKACGNGVVPQQAAEALRRIVATVRAVRRGRAS